MVYAYVRNHVQKNLGCQNKTARIEIKLPPEVALGAHLGVTAASSITFSSMGGCGSFVPAGRRTAPKWSRSLSALSVKDRFG
jgi:hypothetical protein